MNSDTMSGEIQERDSVGVDETLEPFDIPITRHVVSVAMLGGLAGTVLMMPILVGIPELLGLFTTTPITKFAGFAQFFGLEPTLALGIFLFGFGGTVVLPLTFLVLGAFLPPESPRYLRGATFATFFWTGFVPAFWPDAGILTIASFLVFSLLAHWVYGLTLGMVIHRVTGVPQHQV
ncbi:cytochrome C oxidase subunit I [Halogeometricum borinquense]|uniref:Cytochrome C oxidase subunit I n=2 Tax=Halogeometricum borinquense TaxID=60847 RepID=A0A6C0UGL3_9EURY|nr:cytochrome C oxidase subunit I [Halogeometricum borinquense]QIQ76439.1 cytochrome C oxidase subunit I [Halogeometricum borinquense]